MMLTGIHNRKAIRNYTSGKGLADYVEGDSCNGMAVSAITQGQLVEKVAAPGFTGFSRFSFLA